ncbi:MAG: hypothetical protein U0Z44_05685 [Kouleothrix sp.]
MLYFFVPLVATAQFSLLAEKGQLSLLAYQNVLTSPEFFQLILVPHRADHHPG